MQPSSSSPASDDIVHRTALSAVFRRIAGDSPPPLGPEPEPEREPEGDPEAAAEAPWSAGEPSWSGFGEPVEGEEIPVVEGFAAFEREAAEPESEAGAEADIEVIAWVELPSEAVSGDVTAAEDEAELEAVAHEVAVHEVAVHGGEATEAAEALLAADEAEPDAEEGFDVTSESGPDSEEESAPDMSPNRRMHRRVRLPAEIEIGGEPCTLIDLSLSGFAATGVGPVEAEATVPVTVRLVMDGIEVGTQMEARIIYAHQARSSGHFVELTPSQTAFLRYIITWRGESVGAAGTTTLLDAIGGDAARGTMEDETRNAVELPEEAPRDRWWSGLLGRKISPPR